MYIAVDFDETCVTHEYPNTGRNIGAEIVLKALVECGHKLILHTMRCSPVSGRDTLVEALDKKEKRVVHNLRESW